MMRISQPAVLAAPTVIFTGPVAASALDLAAGKGRSETASCKLNGSGRPGYGRQPAARAASGRGGFVKWSFGSGQAA